MSNNDAPSSKNDEGEQQNEHLLDSPSYHCFTRKSKERRHETVPVDLPSQSACWSLAIVTAGARRIGVDPSHVSVPACIKFTTSLSWLCLVVESESELAQLKQRLETGALRISISICCKQHQQENVAVDWNHNDVL
jgi:hypothetical protein